MSSVRLRTATPTGAAAAYSIWWGENNESGTPTKQQYLYNGSSSNWLDPGEWKLFVEHSGRVYLHCFEKTQSVWADEVMKPKAGSA